MALYGDWSQYEWDVEEVVAVSSEGQEEGEVQEHWFQTCAVDCIKLSKQPALEGMRWEIVLVRDDQDCRSWAYVDMKTMKLPSHFEDAAGNQTTKVPKRFHLELEKACKMVC